MIPTALKAGRVVVGSVGGREVEDGDGEIEEAETETAGVSSGHAFDGAGPPAVVPPYADIADPAGFAAKVAGRDIKEEPE